MYSNRSKENLPKTGVRFKAETSGNTTTNKTVPDLDSIAKKIPPKYSIAAELQRQEKEKVTSDKHQISNVTGDYQHEIVSNYYKDGQLDSGEYKQMSDYLNHKTTPPIAYYGRIDKNNDLENSEYSKPDMMKFNVITENELALSKDEHVKRWKDLAKLTSWVKPKMTNVLFEMIDHFADGSGTNYTNKILTQEVENHPETQRYMKDFSKVFEEQLQVYSGDVASLLASNSLKNELNNKKIYLSTYDYSGIGDLFGGLEHAIHSWTESEVEISSLKINQDGTYRGELNFIFVDNFGLDNADIEKFGDYAGFRSWFILQHYDKFSDCAPFKAVVKINYPISGKIEGYKK